jgi:hypothetical protein
METVPVFPDSILTQYGNIDKALPQSFARLRGEGRGLSMVLSSCRQNHEACEDWARLGSNREMVKCGCRQKCQPLAY